ncbi:protein spaetzle-like isoform X2 [Euwallacea fornicatus]|uniref:protein spaetzle-like isoform X2 n=1 Tax=Euwallacea fornicatus TaxID=995702 RepID=UPI00338D6076
MKTWKKTICIWMSVIICVQNCIGQRAPVNAADNSTAVNFYEHVNRSKPRILSHLPKGEFYGREQEIFFPDSLLSDRMDVVSRSPKCAGDLPYCEEAEAYPYSHIKRVLQGNLALKSLFGTDEVFPEISDRLGNDDETFVCRSIKKTIFPKMGENKNNKWKFIINQNDENGFVQGIQVELCRNPDKPCDIPGSPSMDLGYSTSCRQKYVYRRLFTLDNTGEPVSDSFKMPSACCCAYKQNYDFMSRLGKGISAATHQTNHSKPET